MAARSDMIDVMGFAALYPSYILVTPDKFCPDYFRIRKITASPQPVGWIERSETHHVDHVGASGHDAC